MYVEVDVSVECKLEKVVGDWEGSVEGKIICTGVRKAAKSPKRFVNMGVNVPCFVKDSSVRRLVMTRELSGGQK